MTVNSFTARNSFVNPHRASTLSVPHYDNGHVGFVSAQSLVEITTKAEQYLCLFIQEALFRQ